MKKLILNIFLVGILGTTYAQTYEIRSVNKGAGVIGIEMRETAGVNTPTNADFVCDIVFGLVWDTAYKVNLGAITSNYNIVKSGGRVAKGNKYFQAFYANNTPFLFPVNWAQNTWVEIASIPNTLDGTGTGTFDVAASGYDLTTNPNLNVNLISDYTPTVNGNALNVPLPVTLLEFKGESIENASWLTWKTASEENFSHFVIEHATFESPFDSIGSIAGIGNSSKILVYNYLDEQPHLGANFYRLKMLDFDGSFDYSEVIRLDFENIWKLDLVLYPNPTREWLHIKSDIEIELVNVYGLNGQKILDFKNSNRLNIQNLNSGTYFLRIETREKVHYKRFVKK